MRGSGISWTICKSAPCSTQTTMLAPYYSTTQFFTGQMPFLPPKQQHQSTEGNNFLVPLTLLSAKDNNPNGIANYHIGLCRTTLHPICIGVWAQLTLGARHFAQKCKYKKCLKCAAKIMLCTLKIMGHLRFSICHWSHCTTITNVKITNENN